MENQQVENPKTCTKCKVVKNMLTDYYKDAKQKCGYRPRCKVCCASYDKESCKCEGRKKEKYATSHKWRITHQLQMAQYEAKRRTEPSHKMKQKLRTAMHGCFKKKGKTFAQMGCNKQVFQDWMSFQLEGNTDGLTLENYGEKWHLDHVIPCAKFDFAKEDDQKIGFHWSNIAPMDATKNLAKHDDVNVEYIHAQIGRYLRFLDLHKLNDSIWSITVHYLKFIDVASPTLIAWKLANDIRGNDLGHGKNGEDWAIRSQGANQDDSSDDELAGDLENLVLDEQHVRDPNYNPKDEL